MFVLVSPQVTRVNLRESHPRKAPFLLLRLGRLSLAIRSLQKTGNERNQLGRFDGLRKMRLIPGGERPQAILYSRMRGKSDRGLPTFVLPPFSCSYISYERVTVLRRHADVADYHIGRERQECLVRFGCRGN